MFKKLSQYSLFLIASILIYGMTLLDILTPIQTYSELENRNLSLRPPFTLARYIKGQFPIQYDSYINDQFLGRDEWIGIKSRLEYALGKKENNNIIYGKNGYLFKKFNTLNLDTLTKNTNTIIDFCNTVQSPVYFMLIPNSYQILNDFMPKGVLTINQEFVTIEIYTFMLSKCPIRPINPYPTLSSNKYKYIYYRTDHHWTTFGAYLAYYQFTHAVGKYTPVPWKSLDLQEVPDFYGTYFSESKPFFAKSDTITYYNPDVNVTIDGKSYPSLYDQSKWETRDKYAAFLWGNNGLTVISKAKETSHPSKILVIKDSFGNSFSPLLTTHYDEIHIIDLRSITFNLSDYLNEHNFDEILILYNFTNFNDDRNISKLVY